MPRTFVFGCMTIAAVLALGQVVLGADTIVGTWKINVANSKYSPANMAPKSGTSKIESVQGGIKVTAEGVDSQGRKTLTEYTTKLDETDATGFKSTELDTGHGRFGGCGCGFSFISRIVTRSSGI
jgi:hypothetical protein